MDTTLQIHCENNLRGKSNEARNPMRNTGQLL